MSKSDGILVTSSCRCDKCNGLLVEDVSLSDQFYWIYSIRCVNCGKVTLGKEVIHATKKDRRINRMDEFQLYRTRSRDIKRSSHSIQH